MGTNTKSKKPMEPIDDDAPFSVVQMDREYLELAKDTEANRERLRAMVDAAAKENGYDLGPLYHGGGDGKFESFDFSLAMDFGMHFGRSKAISDRFFGRNARSFYLKINDFLEIEDGGDSAGWAKSIADALRSENEEKHESLIELLIGISESYDEVYNDVLDRISNDYENENKFSNWTKQDHIDFEDEVTLQARRELASHILDVALDSDFDGFVYDNKAETIKGEDNEVWIALHPSQIKSADTVTYDSTGAVIPLSQRFNPESDNINF
jgi:hypothetical protein